MAALGDTHAHRHTFFFFSVLIAANLVLVTYNVAKSNISSNNTGTAIPSNQTSMQTIFEELVQATGISEGMSKTATIFDKTSHHGMAFVGSTIHGTAHFVSNTTHSSLFAMVHAENDVIGFAASAVNVDTYIQPTSYSKVPVISPVPTVAVVKAIAAVSPPTIAAAPEATVAKTVVVSTIPVSGITSGYGYAWGNCTWWVAIERARNNDPIPTTWGNAATWAERAAYDGYVVNHTPTPGSIMQTADSAGGLGHVAFVTSVDPDGTWHISEMNVLGLDRIDNRTMSPADAAYYYFIHDKN